jgi:two-component system LytT family response regulator
MLREFSDLDVVAQCGDGRSAVAAITRPAPNLLFLDLQLPELDGFDVLTRVDAPVPLEVVVVTAHQEHAARAFDFAAADYLLKPFDGERLRCAVQRVRDRHAWRRLAAESAMNRPVASWDRLAVREHNRVLFLRPADIDWIEAEGNYVRLHTGPRTHLLRETMGAIEQRLAARGFLRIGRSTLVNLERVCELQPLFHGDAIVVLQDGRKLSVTRAYRGQLDDLLAHGW